MLCRRRRQLALAGAGDAAFIKRVGELVLERRLLTRVWEILHVAPPLVVTHEEIDRIVAILDESIGIAERERGVA